MKPSLAKQLGAVELRTLKCELASEDGVRNEVSYVPGHLVERALNRAGINRKQAAGHMGISESLLTRQMQNIDHQHLSWQRLFSLPDEFWTEMLLLIAEAKRIAAVEQTLTITILRKAG